MMVAMMTAILTAHAPQSNFIAGALMAMMYLTLDYTCKCSQMLTSATAGLISSATNMAATLINYTALV